MPKLLLIFALPVIYFVASIGGDLAQVLGAGATLVTATLALLSFLSARSAKQGVVEVKKDVSDHAQAANEKLDRNYEVSARVVDELNRHYERVESKYQLNTQISEALLDYLKESDERAARREDRDIRTEARADREERRRR